MQVSVETTSSLGRKISVSVAADQIDKKIEAKLQQLTKTVKMDGFRPGKVPFRVVKQRYGAAVRDEVIGDLLKSSLFEALDQEKLNPAGMPLIDSVKADAGQPLEFTATLEVYPEIHLADFSNIQVEKFKVEITDKDVEDMIEKIRKQHAEWKEVERASDHEDRLTIDFKGTMNGEAFQGGTAENVNIVLGSKTFIPGFEEGLTGLQAGAEKTLNLQFPEDYHVADLAGKPVDFAVTVKSVSEPVMPELNEEFVGKMGIEDGDVEAFQRQVREHMQRELDNVLKNRQKIQVFEQLAKLNEFDIPQSLIEQEARNLKGEHKHQHDDHHEHHHHHDDEQAIPEAARNEAARRVKLGLIVAEIIKQHELKADQEKVHQFLVNMSKGFEQPEQMVAWYYSNKKYLANVEALVLEEQVIEKVLEQATVSEKTSSYEEAMKPAQHAHSHAE